VDGFFIISGFGVGLLVGLTGVGGGALMTPLLIFGFGITPAVAVGTDLIFAAITKTNGVWVHARQATVDWRIVRRLASGSLPAALITLALLGQIDTHTEQAQGFITTTLGLALILSASALLWRLHLQGVDVGERWNRIADMWARKAPVENGYYAFNDLHALISFLGAGRTAEARTVLTAVEAAAETNFESASRMAREVGIPACSG